MKIAILSIYIGEDFKKITKYARLNKIQYSIKHNYTFIDDDTVYDSSRPPAWSKINLILKYLSSFDYVVYIDADTYILNPEISLESIINRSIDNKDILLSKDWRKINSGVMFIKNTQFCKDFFTQVYAQNQFINSGDWEQDAIIHLYDSDEKIRDKISVVYHTEFNSYWFNYDIGHFILHFAGCRTNLQGSINSYCPIKMDSDTEESFNSRLEWLKGECVLENHRVLDRFKEMEKAGEYSK